MKSLFSARHCSELLIAVLFTCFAQAQTPGSNDGLANYEPPIAPQAAQNAGPAMTLDEAERIALAANPEIEVAARRVAIAQAHVSLAGALDDPMAMYRGWGVPLQRPWNFNDAQNMFSISQAFPGGGKRALRTSVAESDVDVAKAQLDEVRLEVQVRVHKAFDDVLLADDEMQIHHQHVGIARQAIEAGAHQVHRGQSAAAGHAEGSGGADRACRAHDSLRPRRRPGAGAAQHAAGTRSDTPLRAAGEFAVLAPLPAAQKLDDIAIQSRPDLIGAEQAARAEPQRAGADQEGLCAGFHGFRRIHADAARHQHAQQLHGGGIDEPALAEPPQARCGDCRGNGASHGAGCRAGRSAQCRLRTDRGSVGGGAVRRRSLRACITTSLRPQAEATLQSSVIAYENDKTNFLDLLDSQMTVIDVDLAWLQAAGDFDARLADLEMATGATCSNSNTV